MQQTIQAEKFFTGTEWLYNHDIIIEDGLIKALIPSAQKVLVHHDADTFIAPAFIDFQVYGAAQKLFSLYPTVDTLQSMQAVFAKQGTCLFQPTMATHTLAVFKQGVDAVKQYWAEGGKGVIGLHLEGPWINVVKRGAHITECIHPPTMAEVKELIAYGGDAIKTITLAPEVCAPEIIMYLLSCNIIVAAGHSNASYAEATAGFKMGIPTVTHLYNAMSALQHREPGLVGATLHDAVVTASIIPDGHHVAFVAIALAKKIMGERLFAITDAVTQTNSGPYQHQPAGTKYESDGILSGSSISMHTAFYNLVNKVGISIEEALRMCSLYPAKVLGIEYRYGKIAPGYAAQFLMLDKHLGLADVITV